MRMQQMNSPGAQEKDPARLREAARGLALLIDHEIKTHNKDK